MQNNAISVSGGFNKNKSCAKKCIFEKWWVIKNCFFRQYFFWFAKVGGCKICRAALSSNEISKAQGGAGGQGPGRAQRGARGPLPFAAIQRNLRSLFSASKLARANSHHFASRFFRGSQQQLKAFCYFQDL